MDATLQARFTALHAFITDRSPSSTSRGLDDVQVFFNTEGCSGTTMININFRTQVYSLLLDDEIPNTRAGMRAAAAVFSVIDGFLTALEELGYRAPPG